MKKLIYIVLGILLVIAVIGFTAFYRYAAKTNAVIDNTLQGKKWDIPASVYARPLELYPGLTLTIDELERELQFSDYRREKPVRSPGGYMLAGSVINLHSRSFTFQDGLERGVNAVISFADKRVSSIKTVSGEQLPYLRIDPVKIGSFHPLQHEDRQVISHEEIPELLKESLVAIEDRDFYNHHGISLKSISRAFFANVKAGHVVQGGSTLTQQLVKNIFLTREQTFERKFNEALMSILVDWNYSKEEILTTYINEVFLGQDGGRAVHGFGLASHFYFKRNLQDLSPAQIATLVGMVKGPSSYNPLKNPERCLSRRQLVLKTLHNENIIDEATLTAALAEPLTDVSPQKSGYNRFPAFLDLVKHQLRKEYQENDLNSEGLKILTTLDPIIQTRLEEQVKETIAELESLHNLQDIQTAVVVTNRNNGEVQALQGGRESQAWFNRALEANRPIGSLVKPAVYLTALTDGYELSTPVSDIPITVSSADGEWRPVNYDRNSHGTVPLYSALANSYNLATVRIGMDVGLNGVIATLALLGYDKEIPAYPSLLLGSVSMTPIEIAQTYQTIASGGFYQPLRAIRAVTGKDGKLLSRYGLEVEQRFKPDQIYLLNHALQRVMSEGTGRRILYAGQRKFAGKTGTSNDLRDSWFSGYTNDHLAVVWMGKDDNTPLGLTGSSGALQLWGRFFDELDQSPLDMAAPESIRWYDFDPLTFKKLRKPSETSTKLPFITAVNDENSVETVQRQQKPNRNKPDNGFETIEKKAKNLLKSIGDLFN